MSSEPSKEEGRKIKGERTPSPADDALHPDDAADAPDASRSASVDARPQRGEVQRGIADADKKARTGSEQEPVRNTPPAGDWNDVV